MAHIIVLIDGKIDAMKGNATSGSLADLREVADAVDANLPYLDKPQVDEAHELLEQLQEWLCNGGMTTAPVDQVETFITELEPYQ